MADIAALGFSIDTSQLRAANRDLRALAVSAGRAETALTSFGSAATAAGNSAAGAMQRAAVAAGSAAAAAAAARTAIATINAASAANNNHANSALRVSSANSSMTASFLMGATAIGLSTAAMYKAAQVTMHAMDTYTQLQNTLKIAGLAGTEMAAVQDRLFEASNRNGVAINEVTQFFRRMSITQKEVGASNLDMVTMVDVVTAALRIQGTSAKSASGALLQLSQSFGSGRVKAEEFNSIQEGALPLLQAAANGITRFGGSISKLRAEVVAGTVTSKEFFEGILRGGSDLEQLAATTKLTLAGALTIVENSFINLIGRMDAAGDVSNTLTDALKDVSKWLDSLAKDPDFLNAVKTEFDNLRQIVATTKTEIMELIRIFKYVKNIVETEVAKTKAGYNVQALTQAETYIDSLEKIKSELEAERSKEVNVDSATQAKLNAQLTITNEKLAEQIALRDELRGKLTHQIPDPLSTMNPYDYTGVEGGSPYPPISTKRGPGGTLPPKKTSNAVGNAWAKIQEDARKFIATNDAEREALGKTEEQMKSSIFYIDMLTKAKEHHIPITKAVTDKIREMADAMAKSVSARDSAKAVYEFTKASEDFVRQQQIELDTIGMSTAAANAYRKEQEFLFQEQKKGHVLTEQQTADIHASAIAMAEAEQKVKNYSDALEFTKGIFKDFFSDMKDALISGKNLWDAFGNAALGVLSKIADKLLNMAIDGLFAEAFGGASTGQGGSGNRSGFPSGGLSGFFSNIGGSLSSGWDTFSTWAGIGNSQYPDVGSLMQAQGIGGLGGIGWGQALGALGGVANGVMGFMRGGTSGTIQGIGGLLGAGASFIPGIGPFLGPAIGILSSLAGGLFGEQKPTITNQTYGQLTYGSKGFYTTGGAWGPDANASSAQGPLSEVGKSLDSVFSLLGGIKDAAKVWGGSIQSKSVKGANWESNSTSTYLVDPNGNQQLWRMNEGNMMDTLAAQIAFKSIIEGAVGEISDNLKTGLTNIAGSSAPSLAEISTAINDITTLDKTIALFGKDVPEAQGALDSLNKQFDGLIDVVNKYSLSVETQNAVEAERLRQQQKMGGDFSYYVSQGILGFTDPLTAALNDLQKAKEKDLSTNNVFLTQVEGYADQRNAIEELYLRKRNKLIEDYNNGALSGTQAIFMKLSDLIASMSPGGNLSGDGPAAYLAGLQAVYGSTKSAAFANPTSEKAIEEFVKASQALVQYSQDFYGNDTRFVAQRDQAIADARALQALGTGAVSTPAGGVVTVDNDQLVQQLLNTIASQSEQLVESQTQIAMLAARIDRLLATQGA